MASYITGLGGPIKYGKIFYNYYSVDSNATVTLFELKNVYIQEIRIFSNVTGNNAGNVHLYLDGTEVSHYIISDDASWSGPRKSTGGTNTEYFSGGSIQVAVEEGRTDNGLNEIIFIVNPNWKFKDIKMTVDNNSADTQEYDIHVIYAVEG